MMARTSNKCPRDSVKIRLGVGNNTLLTREQYNLEMHCLWMVSLGHFRLCSFTPFPHILLPLSSVVLCPGSHLNCQKFLCFQSISLLCSPVLGPRASRRERWEQIGNKFYTKSDPVLPGRVFGLASCHTTAGQPPLSHICLTVSHCACCLLNPEQAKCEWGSWKKTRAAIETAHVYSLWAGSAAVQQTCCILLCLTQ